MVSALTGALTGFGVFRVSMIAGASLEGMRYTYRPVLERQYTLQAFGGPAASCDIYFSLLIHFFSL